jgi:hypothetical protein
MLSGTGPDGYTTITLTRGGSGYTTELSDNKEVSAYLSSGETHTYTFYANYGGTYWIFWDDRDSPYSDSSYADIKVSARTSNGITTFFNNVDTGYNGRSIYVPSSGAITITVTGNPSGSFGQYLIFYSSVYVDK